MVTDQLTEKPTHISELLGFEIAADLAAEVIVDRDDVGPLRFLSLSA